MPFEIYRNSEGYIEAIQGIIYEKPFEDWLKNIQLLGFKKVYENISTRNIIIFERETITNEAIVVIAYYNGNAVSLHIDFGNNIYIRNIPEFGIDYSE